MIVFCLISRLTTKILSIDSVLVKYYHVELPRQTEATWQCCGQCQMACGRILGMEVSSLVPSCSHHPTNFQMKSNQPHYLHRFLTDVAIIPLLHEEFLRSFIENSYRSFVLDIATSNLIQILNWHSCYWLLILPVHSIRSSKNMVIMARKVPTASTMMNSRGQSLGMSKM